MNEIFNYVIFSFGDFSLKVAAIVNVILIFLIVGVILRVMKASIYRSNRFDQTKKFSIYTLTKYVIIVFAFIYTLRIIGFDVSVLLAGSAALLVGFGLGMQNLFSDYISGLIILIDSSIKVGDILEINGLVCQVQEINLRTTTVFTRDDKYIILPNSDLTRNHLINWTLSKVTSRFEISVGVDYSSNVEEVMSIMKKIAIDFDKIRKDPEPFVRFQEFGDSSLLFSVFFWSDEIFRIENIKSEYRVLLFKEFTKHNIKIPFPQRVVHTVSS